MITLADENTALKIWFSSMRDAGYLCWVQTYTPNAYPASASKYLRTENNLSGSFSILIPQESGYQELIRFAQLHNIDLGIGTNIVDLGIWIFSFFSSSTGRITPYSHFSTSTLSSSSSLYNIISFNKRSVSLKRVALSEKVGI